MTTPIPRRTLLLKFLSSFLFLNFFASAAAFARGGGGHTSFGGSHSSGGGSYGHSSYSGSSYGGGVPIFYGGFSSFQFLLLILFIFVLYQLVKNRINTGDGEDSAENLLHRARSETNQDRFPSLPAFDAEAVRKIDARFSQPAFLDFAYALYAMVHKLRGRGELANLSPYLTPEVSDQYQKLSPLAKEVKGILVAGVQVVSGIITEDQLKIRINFETNYTESVPGVADQSYYSEESWVLSRKKSVLSLIPSKLRHIACPNCGAPPSFSEDGKCGACGTLISRGDFNWSIESLTSSRVKTPPLLTSTVEEEGTDLPTLISPHLITDETAFAARHPEFKFSEFQKRAEVVYFAVQKAWTERKPEITRPYESESIFQMHQYWINEYLKQGMINVLKNVALARVEPVKIDQDEFYESMTVRMYGSMIDYTIYESNQTIATGDAHSPRAFTEYWTFIRSADGGAGKKHDTGCPACGAPLKINQSGHCEYCQALVTSGDFDWVLSEIEQDETYRG